jgi:hypothetical protein
MDKLGSSPFCWLEFNEEGALIDSGASAALGDLPARDGVSDLVVMSHGWKNEKADAIKLYGTLWGNVVLALRRKDPTKIVVAGVLWPAKAYATDIDDAAARAAAGGTRAVGGGAPTRDLDDAEFAAALHDFKTVFGDKADDVLSAARQAALQITFPASKALIERAKAVSGADPGGISDPELRKNAALFDSSDSPDDLMRKLVPPPPPSNAADSFGGTRGLGDAVGSLFQGPRAAVARFLNQLTYFEMKKRAGIVGAALGSQVLPQVAALSGKHLHLVGHSFGARLVTAAAGAMPAQPSFDPFSLTLLQGAYSHNGLAAAAGGAFANVIGRLTGPIAITHTHNDSACTFWYPLASRFSRDTTSAFGDKDDPFGAMGANGAQKLAAAMVAPEVVGPPFAPKRGKVNGFPADAFVVEVKEGPNPVDAHNNVTNPSCGKLVAAVIEA